jgi:hypothetical protein
MVGQMVIMAMYVGCIAICVVNMDGDVRGWIHLITLVWIVTYHRIMEDILILFLTFALVLGYGELKN